jgi:hypothetical protein
MLKIHKDSHLDHGLSPAHIEWMLEQFKARAGFFLETVELPRHLEPLQCGLHGPIVGDEPVPEGEVNYQKRGNRAGDSRMCDRPQRETRLITVIAGPHGEEPCVLYTAFGGPSAPREPWDAGIKTDSEREASVLFWAAHALSAG